MVQEQVTRFILNVESFSKFLYQKSVKAIRSKYLSGFTGDNST